VKSAIGNRKSEIPLTVHMIGNAHLDPVWLWQWTEGFEALVATFRSALDLMKEDPDFTFTSSSAAMYEWIERVEPDMLDEIRERVTEGRWEIVGGWWLQPDCNIPSGESMVRQALYGQRYFEQTLGVRATVGYNVDTFGHAATLPQLLSKAGLKAYIFFRPQPQEKELLEGMFWWEAPDGTRVLTCRPPGHYPYAEDEVAGRIREHAAQPVQGVNDLASFYGVGNHGGGPTRAQIAGIRAADADPELPHVVFGRLDRFFDLAREQRQDYPVLRDELQHHARGCYTTHAGIKRQNRECEALLGTAEAFSTLAHGVAGLPYPHDEFTHAWRGVLFNQFHDILAGSSIRPAYEDARDLYGLARTLGVRALWESVQALARRVDTRGEGSAVLVFNPLPWRARVPIEMLIPAGAGLMTAVFPAGGERIPSQTTRGEAICWNRMEKVLWYDELPALGYRLYFLRPHDATASADVAGMLATSPTCIENDRWRLEGDPEGGHIASLLDKDSGVEVFGGPAAVPLVIKDVSDTWGHDVIEYRDVIGRFDSAETQVEESGPARAALRVTSHFGGSTLVQVFRLYRGSDRIEVDVEIDWHEGLRMLKLAFPAGVEEPVCTSSIPYGHIVRETNGAEEPCGPWVDVSGKAAGGAYGVAVVNDAKHGYDCMGAELRLSVLRSPFYAWHTPDPPPPEKHFPLMDQGASTLRYLIVPHAGPWQGAGLGRLGLEINRPPVAVNEFTHPGELPAEWTGAEAEPGNVVVSALKRSEDGETVIVRLWETAGEGGAARLSVPGLAPEWKGAIGANEVKTLRLTPDGRWQEADLLEFPAE